MNNLLLLNIGFLELNANWNWKEIYSPFARFYYVKAGNAVTYIHGKKYALEPGYLYLTPPFSLHSDECNDYFSLYYIHFYENISNKESIFDRFDFPVKVQASLLDLQLIERLHVLNPNRCLTNIDPKIYDNPITMSQTAAYNSVLPQHVLIETQGALSILMSRFFEFKTVKSFNNDARINKSLQYIHSHINSDISVGELAAVACVSDDHFIRIFKKEMHTTPVKYINIKKIEKARLLLLTTDLSIRNIAMDLSIDNISYFNKIFKQHTGKTPMEYRNTKTRDT
ncbi:MAG: AraC family transcriptional regulator [Dysgonamonadaceae bacterium]|jgi:AraC-like DNA-binding protein|nr:AraC family transcriptional regulator [Dysgonamonadaceae bacterium]